MVLVWYDMVIPVVLPRVCHLSFLNDRLLGLWMMNDVCCASLFLRFALLSSVVGFFGLLSTSARRPL
jgi:hypothetical protein